MRKSPENTTLKEYVQVYSPDKEQLSAALELIKGKYRTMSELAAASNVSQPMLSRIYRMDYTKPLALSILEKLYDAASDDCSITLADLYKFNGMVTKDEATGINQSKRVDGESFLNNQLRGIITNSLFGLGYAIKKLSSSNTKEQPESLLFSDYMVCSLALSLPELKPYIEWGFLFVPTESQESDTKNDIQSFIKLIIRKYAYLFLEDAWAPERLINSKLSFVYTDKEYYKAFIDALSEAKLNSRFSAILVDLKKSQVECEHVFNNNMFDKDISLFHSKTVTKED